MKKRLKAVWVTELVLLRNSMALETTIAKKLAGKTSKDY